MGSIEPRAAFHHVPQGDTTGKPASSPHVHPVVETSTHSRLEWHAGACFFRSVGGDPMISYRWEVLHSWVQDAPSVRGLAALLGMAPPFGLRALIDRLRAVESFVVESDINTDDDAPINGHVKFELRSNGSYVFSGHMRATGALSYHYGVQSWV